MIDRDESDDGDSALDKYQRHSRTNPRGKHGQSKAGSTGRSASAPTPSHMASQTKSPAPSADEGDSPADDEVDLSSKSYSSVQRRGREELCIHCGDTYMRVGAYHGYYCPTCRPPNGFLSGDQ